MAYILALDQGTTSSRAIVFDHTGSLKSVSQQEFRQIFPRAGWVEHDPEEIWSSQLAVARQAMAEAGLSARDISAIGITNQRETTLVWDRTSGRPVYNAIVWQDRRTADFCDLLKRDGHLEMIRERTGLVIDAYFSASKLRWLLDNVPNVRERALKGELAFGTVDSWLAWKLTGGRVHASDVGNASRTMLFNIQSKTWDPDLLRLMDIPANMLPKVCPSSQVYGETISDLFGAPISIGGIAGDQQAALFGQNCFTRGMAKNTYGTGCFMLLNTGPTPSPSRHNLLTTIGWKLGTDTTYALEGSVFIAGAVVQWLRDGLGLIRRSSDIESLAGTVPDSGGVYFVPAFAGLGAPHWDQYARGSIAGLTRGTTAGHLARAALEGIAFQVADVLDAMRQDSGMELDQLRVDGGASANNLLMQFQADMLGVPVVRPRIVETTALGAAYLAGLAVGYWKSTDDVRSVWQTDRVFQPTMSTDERNYRRSRWAEALRRAQDWEQKQP